MGFELAPIKWEGSWSRTSGGGRRKREEEYRWSEGKRAWKSVRCAAEGIERGIAMGRGRERGVKVLEISERMKVVALMACAMCLCNADRVVMSVAVVPLAHQFGWSSSFLGVVQVLTFFFFCICFDFCFSKEELLVGIAPQFHTND